jgi:hypothetical protein
MATEEEIKNQQAFADAVSDTREQVAALKDGYRSVGAEIQNILDDKIKKLTGENKKYAQSLERDIVGGLKRQKVETDNVNKIIQKQVNGSLKVADVNNLIGKYKNQQLSLEESITTALAQGLVTTGQAEKLTSKIAESYQEIYDKLDASNIKAEQFEKKLGVTYGIFKGIEKIPILNALIKVEKVTEAMEKSAATGASIFKVFGTGIGTTFSQIGKSLKDPLVILTAQVALVKKMFDLYGDVNQRLTDQQRQLGVSAEASDKLYQSAYQYASQQENAFVTEKRILEGRYKLNETLGTSIAFSEKEAITAEKLSHYYGISEEQNAHLAVLGREIGQSNADILNTVLKTTVTQKAQSGGTISYQKVLQKVSSTSGDILTKFKGNTQALTNAVIQADKLGLTLEQVDKIGESLLNFETSIESELKAELLTGKAINLEKARSAALSGDTAKLTQEIAKQTGGIHEFEKLNTIQRKAYAEAFGMEAGEMGDMLRKREFEAKLGADAAKSASEQLRIAKERGITIEESVKKDLEAHSLAESQKYVFEKIQSILARISAGPMATIYKYLEKGFHFAEKILSVFGKMTGGALGNALGVAVFAAPVLLGATRLLSGGLKGLISAPGSRINPGYQYVLNNMGMGGAGNLYKGGQFMPGGGRAPAGGTTSGGGMMGGLSKNMVRGGGAALGGMALSGIASSMEPGAGADTVGVLGQTATYAGMGMMIGGPWGAALGGTIGAVMGLVDVLNKNEEKRKADEVSKAESEKKNQAILEQLAIRPIKLDVGTNTVAQWNTANNQYGNSGPFG